MGNFSFYTVTSFKGSQTSACSYNTDGFLLYVEEDVPSQLFNETDGIK